MSFNLFHQMCRFFFFLFFSLFFFQPSVCVCVCNHSSSLFPKNVFFFFTPFFFHSFSFLFLYVFHVFFIFPTLLVFFALNKLYLLRHLFFSSPSAYAWIVMLILKIFNFFLIFVWLQAAILQQTAEYIYQLEQEKTQLLAQNCQLKRLVNQHEGGDVPTKKRKAESQGTCYY